MPFQPYRAWGWTLLLASTAVAPVFAQNTVGEISGYVRFLVYPHLQQGWESIRRGERDRALAEFEQARRLAPENAAVALQLATAYGKFGETGRAESILRAQLQRTPGDERLRSALAALRPATTPPPAVAAMSSCAEPSSGKKPFGRWTRKTATSIFTAMPKAATRARSPNRRPMPPRNFENAIATAASAIKSPARGPMICTPSKRSVFSSARIFTLPSVEPRARARPLAMNGNVPLR